MRKTIRSDTPCSRFIRVSLIDLGKMPHYYAHASGMRQQLTRHNYAMFALGRSLNRF